MITREKFLEALEIVELYRKQCLQDLVLSDQIPTTINPKSLFREVASGRLYKALKHSEFCEWKDDQTVGQIALLVNKYGIDELRKFRGLGGKVGLELELIVLRVLK